MKDVKNIRVKSDLPQMILEGTVLVLFIIAAIVFCLLVSV